MKKIILFLFLLPSFAIAQDTVIITKMYAEDTLWSVKKVFADETVTVKTFYDSTQIYYYILNDIVDEGRKMADALNLIEKQNKYLADLNKLDKTLTNSNFKSSFDYLQEQFSRFWIGNYNAILNRTKVVAGAEIFINQSGSLRIKIGENLNRPLFVIADTYGFINNYPNQGDKMVIYMTKTNVIKDIDNKLILRKKKL